MKRLIKLIGMILLLHPHLSAQEYKWWNEKHNWDGVTPWSGYMIVSPGFMGPNALPVPEVKNGKLPKGRSVELGLDGHYSKGDQTANLFAELFFPLFSQRAGLGISYVPIEIYQTDTLTRDLRRSREFDPSGHSPGDVYVGTYIHLMEERGYRPDLLITVNIKTASGEGFSRARHTNAPGYYFDLSAGKRIYSGEGTVKSMRVYSLVGFYVYQTNLENYMQNDAFQYGAGFDLNLGKFVLENQWGGYTGYLDNGDRPMVYRLNMKWFIGEKGTAIKLRFQQGFFDFPYTTVRFSTMIAI